MEHQDAYITKKNQMYIKEKKKTKVYQFYQAVGFANGSLINA